MYICSLVVCGGGGTPWWEHSIFWFDKMTKSLPRHLGGGLVDREKFHRVDKSGRRM